MAYKLSRVRLFFDHFLSIDENLTRPGALEPTFTTQPLHYLRHLITPYTASEKAALERSKWFSTLGMGYNVEQSTQPQTLGYSLADSPVGLLAWIYEKLVNWTDGYKRDDDEGTCVLPLRDACLTKL
jgi:hypothetical protein